METEMAPQPQALPKQLIWVDTNILVKVDSGKIAEAEIVNLQRDGYEVLLPKSVELEFLHGTGVKDTARRQDLLKRLGLKVDTGANQVPMEQLRAWRDGAV